ncbi:uncharacterized protein LOC133713795 [Rosa rugosa]|uniref:uncharacterized protein LOC133713795 n=1 Tax=Rosa rugosa TaxID=74645 RepID=UPI002B40DA68|nr:uncharacterized protein LOC133713795 [Rosa rugosa]
MGYFFGANGMDMKMQIFLPVHDGSIKDGHWILIVVDMVTKVAEVWDSGPGPVLQPSTRENILLMLRHIDRVMWFDNITQPGSMVKVEDFTIVEGPNVPKQQNAFDCGVYVIQNMQHYRTDWAKQYDSEYQRAAILLDCLTAPNNESDANVGAAIVNSDNGVETNAMQHDGLHQNGEGMHMEEWEEGGKGEYSHIQGRVGLGGHRNVGDNVPSKTHII